VAHTRLWVAGSDGGGVHELFPDRPADQTSVAWSPDGTRLIFSESGKLYLSDASGSEPQVVDTGCVAPCSSDSDAAFSGDGTQLVFRRAVGAESWVIAAMDLASGRVVELSSTPAVFDEGPRWSPDGKQIAFSRYDKVRGDKTAVFVMDADGQNLHQLSPATLPARFPEWSPDGSRIVFTSFVDQIVGVLGKDAASHLHRDVYTARPDGSDLRRLTDDGISSGAAWTPDGRLLFSRIPLDSGNMPTNPGSGLWTMDADGTNAAQLLPFPGASSDTYGGVEAAWQPTP
jgi:Tol biopolymer transport system component